MSTTAFKEMTQEDMTKLVELTMPGNTPLESLHAAFDLYGPQVVQAQNRFGHTVLMMAAWRGDMAVLRCMVEAGAELDRKDIGGSTALHWAAMGGEAEAVDFLLKRSADRDLMDRDGIRAFDLAHKRNHHNVLAAFKAHDEFLEQQREAEAQKRAADMNAQVLLHAEKQVQQVKALKKTKFILRSKR